MIPEAEKIFTDVIKCSIKPIWFYKYCYGIRFIVHEINYSTNECLLSFETSNSWEISNFLIIKIKKEN